MVTIPLSEVLSEAQHAQNDTLRQVRNIVESVMKKQMAFRESCPPGSSIEGGYNLAVGACANILHQINEIPKLPLEEWQKSK